MTQSVNADNVFEIIQGILANAKARYAINKQKEQAIMDKKNAYFDSLDVDNTVIEKSDLDDITDPLAESEDDKQEIYQNYLNATKGYVDLFCALNYDYKDLANDIMAELDIITTRGKAGEAEESAEKSFDSFLSLFAEITEGPIDPNSPYRTLSAYQRKISHSYRYQHANEPRKLMFQWWGLEADIHSIDWAVAEWHKSTLE